MHGLKLSVLNFLASCKKGGQTDIQTDTHTDGHPNLWNELA